MSGTKIGTKSDLRERPNITPVIEDYLKAIYSLRLRDGQVRTVVLAEHLGVKPPSVTAMLKTLAELKLIEYEPYRGVELTNKGEQIALEIVRHHRLIELYLVEALGFSWDEVHEEAEVLEHFISQKLEARIAAYLGDPTRDPHGDPIPTVEGVLPDNAERENRSLSDLPLQTQARVVRVCDQRAELLRYLAGLGIVPGALVRVVASEPFGGPVTVQIDGETHALDRRLARSILLDG